MSDAQPTPVPPSAAPNETLPPTRTNAVDERRSRQHKLLGVFIALSLGLHIGLVGGWLLVAGWERKPAVDLDEAIVKTRLVKLGKPRDEKLLPRLPTSPPPPAQDKKSQPTPEPQPENQKPDASKQPSAADILNKFKEENAKSKDIKDILERVGEETDEGKLDGDKDGTELDGQIKATYYDRIKAHLKRNLEVSATISDEERIRIINVLLLRLGDGGEVLEAKIATSSGSNVFDNDVLEAAKRASPFPAPPPQVRKQVTEGGVKINVCPRDRC